MAVNENATMLADLFDPQVVGDLVDKKLVDLMKFAPLARIDNTLQGRPGSTLTLPSFAYIGDATTVAEGQDIPISTLESSETTVTIHKIAKGVEITDEAVLSGYGDPAGEAVDQIALSIASQTDNEVLNTLSGIGANMTQTTAGATLVADDVADALVKFGEDIEGAKVLLVSPEDYSVLRKADDWVPASDVAAEMVIEGAVGMVHGCQVVVSNKLSTPNVSYIVKPGALAIYLKRNTAIETDRDIIAKSTVITADKHLVTYLYDASKAIKIAKVADGDNNEQEGGSDNNEQEGA